MKCSVCKKDVAAQWQRDGHYSVGSKVAAPHPKKKGPGLCHGSGYPERIR